MQKLDFVKKAGGVYSATLGTPSELYPLHISAAEPRIDDINKLGDCEVPVEIVFEKTKRDIVIRVPAQEDQDIYGLGLQPFSFNHKFKTLTMKIDGNPGTKNGECPAPIPMLIFPQGFAVAVDSLERPTFHMGMTRPLDLPLHPITRAREEWWNGITPMTCMEITVPGENADIYLFCGKDIKEIVQRYVLYCGGGFMPPRTSLGVWQRVHMNWNEKEITDVIEEFRKRGNALNVIGLEPGWHDEVDYPCSYAFNKKRFPDPKRFLEKVKENHAEINLWELPSYAEGFPLYEALKPFGFGSHACQNGASTDLTIPGAAKTIRDYKIKEHLSIGVAGYKTDCSTPYPDHAQLPSGMSGYEYLQIFSSLNMRNELEMFREVNKRTLGLTLGGNLGSTGFPHVYYNDSTDLKNYVRLICNSGFAGLLWSPEMTGSKNPSHWLRRIELATFSANMQVNSWWSGYMPWEHESVAEEVKKYTILRTKLMPYFYQAFSRFYLEGIPPFRPLIMEEDNEFTRNLDTQFMAGDDMVVAPMFYDENEREVYLPEGEWYDLETHKKYEGGKIHTVYTNDAQIPVFVRMGAMIPLIAGEPEYVPFPGEEISLEILCFGEKGNLHLYDDDGATFDYEKGGYGYIHLEFDQNGGRVVSDERKIKTYEIEQFKIIK